MTYARAFEPQDLEGFSPHQQFPGWQAELLEIHENAEVWSFCEGDQVVAIGGIHPIWKDRAWCWAMLSGKGMLGLTRYLPVFIDEWGYARVEMYVRPDREADNRWPALMGFKLECNGMQKFFPDGSDANLYARV